MANLKQTDRLMQFSSPLGRDVLLIESLDGAEGISRLYEFQAQLFASTDTEIDPVDLIGAKVSVAINLNDLSGIRWVNGIVASFEQSSGDDEFDVYHARIVPSLWQLTLSSNCRVFQGKTVMDIVKEVVGEYHLTLSDKTTAAYKPLDYCTQYDESDFHFISRIMEQHGIFYWFEHTDDDNKVIFGDDRSAYSDCAISASFEFQSQSGGKEGAYGANILGFSATATMVTGKHSTRDYDLRTYAAHDISPQTSASPYGANAYEHFSYPAGEEGYVVETPKELTTPDHGTLFLTSSAAASDARAELFRGISNVRSLASGYTFTMSRHPKLAWNRKYLLTELIHHVAQTPSYRSHGGGTAGYSNQFSAISSEVVVKTVQTAHKPRIYGPQTAVVVSPSGEEMCIDKLGRVCVQFFWDRARQPNTIDNTWVRVAQQWAGSGWGTHFWPRLKDEVVVQFLDGDPDNPIVVGSVYNGVNVPKYELPAHSTRTGIVTRSSKDGSAANANELRFEDKKGSEEIYINAEKDMNVNVEHNHSENVGHNEMVKVKKSRWLTVEGSQTTKIDGALTNLIGGDSSLSVGGDQVTKYAGDTDINHLGKLTEKVGGDYSIQISGNHNEKVGSVYVVDSGQEIHLKGGMKVVIEGGMGVCLQGPGGFISIDPSGVTISGTMVLINSGGAALTGSPASVSDPKDPPPPSDPPKGSWRDNS